MDRYRSWVREGQAGAMGYLTDRRAEIRADPRHLLPSARSVLCVGKLYNTPGPASTQFDDAIRGWISRYAWADDYHDAMKADLRRLVELLAAEAGPFESKICVDTAPLLERSYARAAGLGWIGKNTCLINQARGSWFFLGEILVSIDLPADEPPPDRCGSCTRCIDACPTAAILPGPDGTYAVDSRLCISYFTIELRGPIPEQARPGIGHHLFGCDVCQDVCPWNGRAPVTADPRYLPRFAAPPLAQMAALSESEFRAMFAGTPVSRSRYSGFLRNVAIAIGNSGQAHLREEATRLVQSQDPVVAEAAHWALANLP